METIKMCKMIMKYVLEMMECTEFTEMKYTLRAALTILEHIPYYDADKVLTALFGGDEDAE